MAKLMNIAEDCDLPQLREIADAKKLTHTLRRRLGPAFASGELQIEDCTIDQLYYKPREGACRILFTATICRANHGAVGQQVFYGKIFRPGKAQKILDSINHHHLAQPQFGPPVIHIPEWDTVLWAYPNDPNLAGLHVMADAEAILALAKAAPEKFGLPQRPAQVAGEMVKYVPGMRCGAIYRMQLGASTSASAHSPFAVYGKAYRQGEGERAYSIMKQVWESRPRQNGDLVLPQPYSFDSENNILWQEALLGEPFAKIAATIHDLPQVAEEIGRRLAAYHGIHLDLPYEKNLAFQVEEVKTAVAAMNDVFPQYAERCNALGQKLLEASERLGEGATTPLHVSFKFSHIFSTARGIAFIDFDGARLGDPGYDIGRFVAHLYKMKSDWKIDPDVADRTATNFCASYNQSARTPLSQERINWFTASHLLSSQVYKSIKRMDTGLVNKLLKAADRLCPA